jgi:hypothetical protein
LLSSLGDKPIFGRLSCSQREAFFKQWASTSGAIPGHEHRDFGEPKKPKLRTSSMSLGSQRTDLCRRGSGLEREIEVQLLELWLQMKIEEKSADIDQRAQLRRELLITKLLIARDNRDRN